MSSTIPIGPVFFKEIPKEVYKAERARREAELKSTKEKKSPFNLLHHFAPTISTIALGAIFSSNFRQGMIRVLPVSVCITSVFLTLDKFNIKCEDKDIESFKFSTGIPFVTLILPILEEIEFRGVLQPILNKTINTISNECFYGVPIAAIASILATSLCFGYIHKDNDLNRKDIITVSATVAGIALGVISLKWGLAGSIAAHIMHNTVTMCTRILIESHKY